MTERLIPLKTAKLAKKLDFNLESPAFYGCDVLASGKKGNNLVMRDWCKYNELGTYDTQEGTAIYSAPTQTMLQMWVRAKYGVSVEVNYKTFGVSSCNGWYYSFMDFKKQSRIGSDTNGKDLFSGFSSYEDALEAGLQIGLEFIYNGEKGKNKLKKKKI